MVSKEPITLLLHDCTIGYGGLLVYTAAFIIHEALPCSENIHRFRITFMPINQDNIRFNKLQRRSLARPGGVPRLQSYPEGPELDGEEMPRMVYVGCIEPTSDTRDVESVKEAHDWCQWSRV